MASLQKIANELDVSVSLVSKVLNNRLGTTKTRPDVANRIRETAHRLGYRRNASAVALKAGRQNAIAVVIKKHGRHGAGINEAVINGITDAMKGSGQRQSLSFYNQPEEFHELLPQLHSNSIDGLIIAGMRWLPILDDLMAVKQSGVPVVSVFNEPVSDSIPNVGIGDAKLIRLAMQHLIDQGRRCILHASSNKYREAGYFEAMERNGLPVEPEMVYYERGKRSYMPVTARILIERAQQVGIKFDAICCQSDTQAMGAISTLKELGLRVPEDVAVTGVDNSQWAMISDPGITSVSQQFQERGALAVKLLNQIIEGESVADTSLNPELFVRESSGG
ncbi:MAG: LacI family DNA-binding transcriptional regulator [Planctomycetota bacterium]